jgi:hypothetical protein
MPVVQSRMASHYSPCIGSGASSRWPEASKRRPKANDCVRYTCGLCFCGLGACLIQAKRGREAKSLPKQLLYSAAFVPFWPRNIRYTLHCGVRSVACQPRSVAETQQCLSRAGNCGFGPLETEEQKPPTHTHIPHRIIWPVFPNASLHVGLPGGISCSISCR